VKNPKTGKTLSKQQLQRMKLKRIENNQEADLSRLEEFTD